MGMAEWVHCNLCYYQPDPSKGVSFNLTSCGHVFCDKCCATRDKFCFVCQIPCNLLPLNKEIPQDVRVYFTKPQALLEKFTTQFSRVTQFQNSQRERLLQHKLSTIEARIHQRQKEVLELEKENAQMRVQLSSQRQHPLASPMSITPSPPIHPPFHHHHHHASSTDNYLKSLQSTPSLFNALSNRMPSSVTPTPNRTFSSLGSRSVSSSPVSRSPNVYGIINRTPTSSGGQGMIKSAIGSSRLCIRTPPIDGKMGIIPGIRNTN